MIPSHGVSIQFPDGIPRMIVVAKLDKCKWRSFGIFWKRYIESFQLTDVSLEYDGKVASPHLIRKSFHKQRRAHCDEALKKRNGSALSTLVRFFYR